jgi:hypothetical protein
MTFNDPSAITLKLFLTETFANNKLARFLLLLTSWGKAQYS